MNTYTHNSKKYGEVTIHVNSDYSGIAYLSYTEQGERKQVELPAELLIEIGVKSAARQLKANLVQFIESLPED
jgi:hypothetical protein